MDGYSSASESEELEDADAANARARGEDAMAGDDGWEARFTARTRRDEDEADEAARAAPAVDGFGCSTIVIDFAHGQDQGAP